MKAIHISNNESMTICRKKKGRGFGYYNEKNIKISDNKTLLRIKKLVIPPMWTEVFISKDDKAHIQAIGRDLKNRKQYIYHEEWALKQQQLKFKKLHHFVNKLPDFRSFCLKNLKDRELSKKKVLSIICLILDEHGIRVGNAQYVKDNESFGLSTIRRKHIEFDHGEMHLKFKGKSHKYLDIAIEDPKLAKLIQKCSEMPGYEIFKYKQNGEWIDVDSHDINEFIHENLSADISSKFFRTWVATRNCVELYSAATELCEQNKRKQFMPTLVKMVADSIGNTVSVCRKYYIHPRVLKEAERKRIPLLKKEIHDIESTFSEAEKIAIELIR